MLGISLDTKPMAPNVLSVLAVDKERIRYNEQRITVGRNEVIHPHSGRVFAQTSRLIGRRFIFGIVQGRFVSYFSNTIETRKYQTFGVRQPLLSTRFLFVFFWYWKINRKRRRRFPQGYWRVFVDEFVGITFCRYANFKLSLIVGRKLSTIIYVRLFVQIASVVK